MRISCDPLIIALLSGLTLAKLTSFSPSPPHKTFTVQVNSTEQLTASSRLQARSIEGSYVDSAKQYVKTKFGFEENKNYVIKKHYTSDSDGVSYVYLRQIIQGAEVFNADMNINLLSNGKVLSFGDSFYRLKSTSDEAPTFNFSKDIKINKESLIKSLDVALKAPGLPHSDFKLEYLQRSLKLDDGSFVYNNKTDVISDFKATQGWIQLGQGKIEPVWNMDIQLKNEWFNSKVSLNSNELLSLIDWIAEVNYRVYPINKTGPHEGDRSLIENPQDTTASPKGWHDNGVEAFNFLRGNNAYVRYSSESKLFSLGNKTNDVLIYSDPNSDYDFELDITKVNYTEYRNASATNLFYIINMMHDLLYKYGFDEVSGNFQENNFGNGGMDNDAVQAFVQHDYFPNNAGFSTPEDGKQPRMLMGLFNSTVPNRDSSLDNSVIIHEYGHGLSNRLVGGANNPNCLSKPESRGMGEGWSDILSVMFNMKKEYTRSQEMGIASFSANNKEGGRASKYSVKYGSNDRSYSSLNRLTEVHAVGHIWATMLYEVYWNLVDKLGFTSDWLGEGATDPKKYGNSLMLKLLVQSLKLMPCNPTFLDARDSLISADLLVTKGDNKCQIWNGFSKRGLGTRAEFEVTGQKFDKDTNSTIDVIKYTENFSDPSGCEREVDLTEVIVGA